MTQRMHGKSCIQPGAALSRFQDFPRLYFLPAAVLAFASCPLLTSRFKGGPFNESGLPCGRRQQTPLLLVPCPTTFTYDLQGDQRQGINEDGGRWMRMGDDNGERES
eukprot:2345298-Rhodomonas_salina.1